MSQAVNWTFKAPHPFDTDISKLMLGDREITCDFTYDETSGHLKAVIDTGINERGITLEFSNIGAVDPVEFLIGLDWGYVRDKTFGTGGKDVDFPATIASLQKILDNFEGEDMSRDQAETLRKTMRTAMAEFDGDDKSACLGMISGLQDAGFTDDTHHMFRRCQTEQATRVERYVWEPLVHVLEDYQSTHDTNPLIEDVEVEDDHDEMDRLGM